MSQATIVSVTTQIVDLPTIRPHRLAMHTMNRQSVVHITIRCSDEIVGLGEATTIGGLAYGGESPESIKTNIDAHFTPLMIDQAADRVGALMHRLRTHIKSNTFAFSGIETALLDAQGKRLGVPVSELLGGRVRDRLEVAWTLASGDTATDIAEAERMLEQKRHRIFKLKIGANAVNTDLKHVLNIKKALGDSASVRVDVNQAWDESTALYACRVLGENGIDLIEQPIGRQSLAAQARLNLRSPAAIMADESIESVEDAYNLAAAEAASVFALKIAKNGGPSAMLRSASIASAAGIALYGGTMLEGTVGTAATAHACSTLSKLTWGTELFGPLLLSDDFVSTPLVYENFELIVPNDPGLGVEIDEDKLNHYTRSHT